MSDKQLERQESNTEPDPRYFVPLKRRYSESENQVIKNFMHEDFPHIRYGWLRDRGIIIEYPPKIIADKQEWREALDTVLKPEIGELHPNIRRRRMIVRFVDKLHIEGRISVSGDCRSVITDGMIENWIRINYIGKSGIPENIATCLGILMHELTEQDFWEKTQPADKEAVSGMGIGMDFLEKGLHTEYFNLLDEKVANRRAARALRRKWPKADWIDSRYEEDTDMDGII